MKFYLIILGLTLLRPPIQVKGQKLLPIAQAEVSQILTNGFTISWKLNQQANAWVTWSATHTDQSGKETLGNEQDLFRWTFKQGEPARFYKVDFFAVNQSDTLHIGPVLYSTRSMSSGEVLVYFNHEVDHSVAKQTPAKYLNRLVDDTLIAYLNRAKETIDISIYNSSSSNSLSNIAAALNNAHARGVQVRIVYDKETSNTMLPNVSAQIGKIASKIGFAFGIMHNKFVVIDADAENPDQALVWTGSTNWTVDQMNGRDENNVIIVRDQALARAYTLEFEEMFGSTGAQPNLANSKFGPEKTDNTPHEFNVGGRRVRAYFSPSDGTNAQLIGVINSASADIEFASMIITRFDLANAISNKISQGVTEVYGITNDSLASEPAPQVWRQLKDALWFNRMTSNNGFAWTMHHKFIIADATADDSDPQVFTGSHNWSNAAEQRNDENTLIVHDADIANQFYQAFSWMYKRTAGRSVGITPQTVNAGMWKIFPNPASDQIYFEGLHHVAGAVSIQLRDFSGRVILSERISGKDPMTLSLTGITEGIYLIEIESENQKQVCRIMVTP
jgi:phosphatidylserine/phosphatidylglycerophosphate/cardiolipin synthase-like enzyme